MITWKTHTGRSTIKFDKNFTFEYPEQRVLRHIAMRGFAMIKDRITQRQELADGSKLPPLKRRGRFFVTKQDYVFKQADKREPGVAYPTNSVIEGPGKGGYKPAKPGRRDQPAGTMFLAGGLGAYAKAKIRAGAEPVRDGQLTGDMWNSPRANITRVSEDMIRVNVGFRGNSKRGGKPVRNHDKAYYFTRVDKDGKRTKKPQFFFMTWNDAELAVLEGIALSGTKLFKRSSDFANP